MNAGGQTRKRVHVRGRRGFAREELAFLRTCSNCKSGQFCRRTMRDACDDVCNGNIEEEADLLRSGSHGREPHRGEHTCAVGKCARARRQRRKGRSAYNVAPAAGMWANRFTWRKDCASLCSRRGAGARAGGRGKSAASSPHHPTAVRGDAKRTYLSVTANRRYRTWPPAFNQAQVTKRRASAWL